MNELFFPADLDGFGLESGEIAEDNLVRVILITFVP